MLDDSFNDYDVKAEKYFSDDFFMFRSLNSTDNSIKIKLSNINKSLGWRVEIIFLIELCGERE